ncbi:hypothetical protein [Nocardioides sp.]|uniref:hypothetical protein n=1 Tax=Nocardioides sp. TaxID=35761 RepID=UPI002CF5E9F1|nr:hypothetical protein [Nocardioides sp.]HXH79509.1 hypothetical protein [Nocardioides sp.]
MDVEWIAAVAAIVAALCATAAWHAARINATTLTEIQRSLGARLTDSVDSAGREQRAIGKLEGGKDERLDQAARLEHARENSVLVTELPSEERRADEAE